MTPWRVKVAAIFAVTLLSSGCQKKPAADSKPSVPAAESKTPIPDDIPFGISGEPRQHISEGADYVFRPSLEGVPKLEAFRYSVKNIPRWASFNTKTGELTGRPDKGDAGNYAGIEISAATDSGKTALLPPFSIRVTVRNSAPTIDGTPAAEIRAGEQYVFVPDADDADLTTGDQLRFAVANKPPWLLFDAVTGKLSGTPTPEQTGLYERILLAVTDGNSAPATLAPFSIRVLPPDPAGSGARPQGAEAADIQLLVDQLASSDLPERQRAARTLAALGTAAAAAVPSLALGLMDPSPAQQIACAKALGRIGEKARDAVPELAERTTARDSSDMRTAAIEALGNIGDSAALPALEQAVADDDLRIKRAAARALGTMGTAAKPAIPALSASLRQGNEDAAQALGKIGDPAAVPVLTEALSDWRTVYGAAWALKEIGPAGISAAPQLEQIVATGTTTAIRRMAEEALAGVRRGQP